MSLDLTHKVEIYWNVRKGCWSIRQSGKVVRHTGSLLLSEVDLIVREKGRQRTLKQQRKNVHAWAKGYLISNRKLAVILCTSNPRSEVTYNPYLNSTFMDELQPIYRCSHMLFREDGTCYTIS